MLGEIIALQMHTPVLVWIAIVHIQSSQVNTLYWMTRAAIFVIVFWLVFCGFLHGRWENDSQHLCPAVFDCVPAGHRGVDSLHLQCSASDRQIHVVYNGVCHHFNHHHGHRHQHPPPLSKHSHHAALGQEGELSGVACFLVSTEHSVFYWQVF